MPMTEFLFEMSLEMWHICVLSAGVPQELQPSNRSVTQAASQ